MSGTFRIRLQLTIIITPGFSATPAVADLWWGNTSGVPTILTSSSQIPLALSETNNPVTNGLIQMQFGAVTQATLHFDTGGSNIILDGDEGHPYEFNGLPAGFVALSAEVVAEYFKDLFDPLNIYTIHLQKDATTESSPFTVVTEANTFITFPYVFSLGLPTMLDIVHNGCGLRLNASGAGFRPVFFQVLDIEGTYDIISYTWTLENPGPVVPSTTPITVTSGTLDLSDLDIFIQYIDPGTGDVITTPAIQILTQEEHLLIFIVDFPIDVFEIKILAVGNNGTQFSGSVILGTLTTIYFTDASGIYKLVVSQKFDTLYIQDDPPNTIDVKIPDPFIKTGFLP